MTILILSESFYQLGVSFQVKIHLVQLFHKQNHPDHSLKVQRNQHLVLDACLDSTLSIKQSFKYMKQHFPLSDGCTCQLPLQVDQLLSSAMRHLQYFQNNLSVNQCLHPQIKKAQFLNNCSRENLWQGLLSKFKFRTSLQGLEKTLKYKEDQRMNQL